MVQRTGGNWTWAVLRRHCGNQCAEFWLGRDLVKKMSAQNISEFVRTPAGEPEYRQEELRQAEEELDEFQRHQAKMMHQTRSIMTQRF